ncbi:MAG: reverse gyrase [Desulfurococcales archaeon ex4484_58]|nr:MAG: reverse gyrase [Desulfurococcales archaeon ex4484_58]
MTVDVNPVYEKLCPICGGRASVSEIKMYGSCRRCSTREKTVLNALTLHQVLLDEQREFNSFFQKITNGYKPWGAQETWLKRLLNNENTVIIAPTGMGKTTLLLAYALYASTRYQKKTLILTPTKTLAKQTYLKLLEYSDRLDNRRPKILYYDSSLSKKKREELLEKIKNGEYNILVLTNHFLIKRFDLLSNDHIHIVMIDDVDALLKNNKNIAKLLKLLGYSDELIEKVKEKHRIIWKIILSKTFEKEELIDQYIHKLIEIEEEIEELMRKTKKRQVIIASATGKMKGSNAKILRELLRIDVSGITIYGRNITDTYKLIDNDPSEINKILTTLGKGGLILVSPRHPFREKIDSIVQSIIKELRNKGFRVEEATPSNVKKFIEGEIDYLIGSSSYYGICVRGIDAPKTIRYVVFLGTPVFTVELDTLLASPNMLVRTALFLAEYYGENRYRRIACEIRKKIFTLTNSELRIISMLLKKKLTLNDLNNKKLENVYKSLEEYYRDILNDLKALLSREKVLEVNTLTFYYNGEKYVAMIPDVLTYIQGSGRASRLYLGRMTHGLSIIFEFHELSNLVKALDLKLSFYSGSRLFRELDKIDLEKELDEIISSRRNIDIPGSIKYKNILVVVESPTKAKSIAKFFGKPVKRKIGTVNIYEIPFVKNNEVYHLNIMATRGHIYDLTTNPKTPNHGIVFNHKEIQPHYDTIKRCRVCGHQFTYGDQCPRCGSRSYIDSLEIINVLRKLAGEAHEIYIATDPDIEGEKIAYDVYLVVKEFNKNIWRIELHEITLREFMKALERKRSIDEKLVEAEIYRRSLDRLIGFSLSHELWRKYGKKWFGAGRVQTPVLGWIIDKYNEYSRNKCRKLVFRVKDYPRIHLSICIPYKDRDLYDKLSSIGKARFKHVKTYIETINPKPPYTTDELLYDASRYGISSSTTMKIAQELFESGLITYHRTNHHYISSTGISIAMKYLEEKKLIEYSKPSHWGEPGAHEAIRPVHPLDRMDLEKTVAEGLINPIIPLTHLHYRIYDLIFKRFISSQMKPYRVLRREYLVELGEGYSEKLVLDVGIVENGFNLIVKPRVYEELRNILEFESDIELIVSRIASKTVLYNEGGIIKKMKNEGLGRPSTYAKIISSIARHGYIIRSKKRNYLIPTKTGVEVYGFLTSNYPELVSVETTRRMEEMIDRIACGELSCGEALTTIYGLIKEYKLPLSIIEVETSISS